MAFAIACPCCGVRVEASDPGFGATTVSVTACPTQVAAGIVLVKMRRSAAYTAAGRLVEPDLQHPDGLVTFGGSR